MFKLIRLNNSAFRILFVFLGFSISSFAQEGNEVPEMITDRPDATESPNTVPKSFFQVESGGFYESFESDLIETEVLAFNTTLLRYGILDNFEFRLGWNFEETRVALNGDRLDNVLTGFSPLLVGMKVEIAKERGWMPDIGLLGHLYLPFTASTDYRPNTTGVDFRFSFAHTLSENSSLAYNLGGQWVDDLPAGAFVYTLVYGYNISEKFGIYAELYGDISKIYSANHLWDAGITYSLKPNIQLDATIGSSITEGQDILLSTGVSFRLPK